MHSIAMNLCWAAIAGIAIAVIDAIVSGGRSDAAGNALAAGYMAIGVVILLVLFILPAMLLAATGHLAWLALTLSGIAALPSLVFGIGGVIGLVETWRKKKRRRG